MEKFLRVKKKVYQVKDFAPLTDFAINLKISDKIKGAIATTESVIPSISPVVKGYFINGQIYLYCQNGILYKLNQGELEKVIDCNGEQPVLTSIIYNGENQVLATLSFGSFVLLEEEIGVNIPFGHSLCTLNGTTFIADDSTIYYSDEFDFDNISNNLNNFGYIKIDSEMGKILQVFGFEGQVIIVLERAICQLKSVEQTSYKLQKLNLATLEVKKGSVQIVGDQIVFLNNKTICAYKNGNLLSLSTLIEDYSLKENAGAKAGLNKYYLPVISDKNNKTYLYILDTSLKQECIIENDNFVLCGGDYLVKRATNKLVKIEFNSRSNLGGQWVSKRIDFKQSKPKTLRTLSVKTGSSAILTISGDFGKNNYSLKEGYNTKYLNLYSNYFVIEITFLSSEFSAENLQLEYTL